MREAERRLARTFLEGRARRPTLGLLYGRRRIGKSTLLVDEVGRRGGFSFEATRVETPVHLKRLGGALGEHLGVGRIELRSSEEALTQLLRLAGEQAVPVVLDEFGYLLEADPSLPSVIASTFGPGGRGSGGRARMVLCGSAIAMMRSLTAGEAALRGRAGLELVMLPDDYRVAATRLSDPSDTTVPGERAHVGPSRVVAGRVEWQLDIVVADDHPDVASRRITAIGDAKAGEVIGRRHLDRLIEARHRLGPRAGDASLLLIGSTFDPALRAETRHRDDVELIGLDRLYHGD